MKKKNFFALGFSDQEVCLVQADQKGKAALASTLKLEPGVIKRGWIKKPKELRKSLAKFLIPKKLKKKFVAVGLSEITAFSRVLTLPKLSLEELNDAVKWQSEPLLPVSINEAYLDWMLLGKNEVSCRVLVMAFPSSLVEDYARILEGLGFQPVAFEPTSLSLSRLIGKKNGASLVIEKREKEAVLVVVGPHGEVEITSTVSFDKEGGEDEVFSTINELLAFYEKKVDQKNKVSKVFICGSGAGEKLAAEIKSKTSLSTELVSVKPIQMASAVSLARKNVAAPIDKKTINLIPPRIQGVYDLAEKTASLSNWIKFWLFGLFLILFAYGVSASRVYFDLKKIEGEIIERQVLVTPEMRKIEARAKIVSAKATRVFSLLGSQREIVLLLDTIKAAVPEGISLSHLSVDFEKRQVIINGMANHRDQLLNLRQNFEENQRFSQVRIPLSSLEKEENINFTVSLIVKEES